MFGLQSEPVATAQVVRRRRDPRLLALGIVAICLGGLGSAWLYVGLAGTQQVLSMTRTVYRGEVLAASDLSTVSLAPPPGLSVVSSDRVSELVGKTALVDLPTGGLVCRDCVGAVQVPADHARLGLRVAAGRLPVSPLPAGTSVLLVPVAGANGQLPAGSGVAAVVASAPVLQADGASLLDVTVPASEAERLARLAAADQLSMVREGG
jgi:hypothetical protein